jgi:hypothetical protein
MKTMLKAVCNFFVEYGEYRARLASKRGYRY